MRLIFAGSPAAAIPSLDRVAGEHDVVAVLTREDAPLGRKRVLTPSPVAARAAELGLPIVRANRLTADVVAELSALRADLGVIVAYGALLREPLLSAPALGWVNLHFSLLPRWRGAAPVQRALIAGDGITGVSVFQLVPELDAGAVYASREFRPGAHQTAGQLLDALAEVGADVLAEVVRALAEGSADAVPQEGDVTLAPKLTLEDGMLRLGQTSDEVYARFRGVTPEPGAYLAQGADRLKVLDLEPVRDAPRLAPGETRQLGQDVLVGTATSPLRLVTVQAAGKRAMPAADWWRGLRSEGVVFDA